MTFDRSYRRRSTMPLATHGETVPCRDCVRPIIWTRTLNEKRMPLDADPNPAGDFIMEIREGRPPLGVYMKGRHTLCKRYTCHFDTCPKRKK